MEQNESTSTFWWMFLAVIVIVIVSVANQFIPAFLIIGVIVIIGVLSFIGWFFPMSRTPIIIGVILLVLFSGMNEIAKHFDFAWPFVVDNSTNLYPLPEDPNPAQKETLDWVEGKWVIGPGEGAQRVFIYSWASAFVSFLMFLLISWIMARNFLPDAIRGASIPIQLILAAVFFGIGFKMIVTPLNTEGMSEAAIEVVKIQWFGGFLKDRWWPMLITAIITVTQWLTGKASRWPIAATAMSAATWILLPLIYSVFDPTMISWTACTVQVHNTEISMSLCQEAYASGSVSMFILSMAWGWIINAIADYMGLNFD